MDLFHPLFQISPKPALFNWRYLRGEFTLINGKETQDICKDIRNTFSSLYGSKLRLEDFTKVPFEK